MENRNKIKENKKSKRIARTDSCPTKAQMTKQESFLTNKRSKKNNTVKISHSDQCLHREGKPECFSENAISYTFAKTRKRRKRQLTSFSLEILSQTDEFSVYGGKVPKFKSDNQVNCFEDSIEPAAINDATNVNRKLKFYEEIGAIEKLNQGDESFTNKKRTKKQQEVKRNVYLLGKHEDCITKGFSNNAIQWPPPRKINRSLTNYDKNRKRDRYDRGKRNEDKLLRREGDGNKTKLHETPKKNRKPPSIADIVWHKCRSLEDIVGEDLDQIKLEAQNYCNLLSQWKKKEKELENDDLNENSQSNCNKYINFPVQTCTEYTHSTVKQLKEEAQLPNFHCRPTELSESSSQESVGYSNRCKNSLKNTLAKKDSCDSYKNEQKDEMNDSLCNYEKSCFQSTSSEQEDKQTHSINKWFGDNNEYSGNSDVSQMDDYVSEGEPRTYTHVPGPSLVCNSYTKFSLSQEENNEETNWNYETTRINELNKFNDKRLPSTFAQILSQASTDSEGREEVDSDAIDVHIMKNHPQTILLTSKREHEESCSDSALTGDFYTTGFNASRNVSPGPYNIDSDSGERSTPRSPYIPRRYSKRPLRGPYGEMLEAEMSKSKPNSQYLGDELYLHSHDEKTIAVRPSSPQSPTLLLPKELTSRDTSPSILISEDLILDNNVYSGNFEGPSFTAHCSRKDSTNGNESNTVSSPPLFFSSKDSEPSLLSTIPNHQRTASSPSKLFRESEAVTPDKQLLGYFIPGLESQDENHELTTIELRKGRSAEDFKEEEFSELKRRPSSVQQQKKSSTDSDHARSLSEHRHAHRRHRDTRPHVVCELRDTEANYVRNLYFLLNKYDNPLRSSENSAIVDPSVLDAIFYQVPEIYGHHSKMLEELKLRLESQDESICVGDILVKMFKDPNVLESYSSFINNWKTAQEAAKAAAQAKPAFKHFLITMTREHPGKRELKSLLIAPVQRFPRYELILKRLLEHTSRDHPDFLPVKEAIGEVQRIANVLNEIEQETLKQEQQQFILKEIEACIEGIVGLQQADRTFIQVDQVTQHSNLGMRKERCLFLFSDLLVITAVKRRSATVRKITSLQPVLLNFLESCKLKLFKFIPLDDIEIGKAREDSIKRKYIRELEALEQDLQTLQQVSKLVKTLHFPKGALEEALVELDNSLHKQYAERQRADSHLSELELNITTPEGVEVMGFIFHKPEAKDQWEEAFNSAKQKQALSADRRPPPEFVGALPIRKTRAGLQFTCAAPILSHNAHNLKDVWVCNSDGYVGQVCVMSLQPEPTLASCIGVCNAKILSIASVPSAPLQDSSEEEEDEDLNLTTDIRNQRSESLPPEINIVENESQQPTMWLGTEDGSVIVYNCSDTIRTKRNKFKFQPGSPVHCIIHVENRVFASLANGDVVVYDRDCSGSWNGGNKQVLTLSTAASPVTRMVVAAGQLWCSVANGIRVVNVNSLQVEHTFTVGLEEEKSIACMVSAGYGVWLALSGSSNIKLFHATTYELVYEVAITSAITKMLAGCDDIIRQHKAACLRVTSLLVCKDLLWIGTSAGVLLTVPLPHLTHNSRRIQNPLNIVGISHGHTGHVRFLTSVELNPDSHPTRKRHPRFSFKGKDHTHHHQPETVAPTKFLVISGGDGYEDFRNSSLSETAGKDDSTNHLLLWQV